MSASAIPQTFLFHPVDCVIWVYLTMDLIKMMKLHGKLVETVFHPMKMTWQFMATRSSCTARARMGSLVGLKSVTKTLLCGIDCGFWGIYCKYDTGLNFPVRLCVLWDLQIK